MRDYKSLLESGNKAQMEKLLENGFKQDWQDMDFDDIAGLIYEESEEVHEELIKRNPDYKLLKYECADLMNGLNFMIMLCDKELEK